MTRLALAALILLGGDRLTREEFDRLHKELQPARDEVWRTIPWKVSIAEARDQAAQEKKPLFMWSMDGHPLGCT